MNSDLAWGLQMTVLGMGTVFLLLIVLMLILMGITRLDRPPAVAEADEPPTLAGPDDGDDDMGDPDDTRSIDVGSTDGLDPDTLAAIAVAVLAEDERHRRPALTTGSTPGSQPSHWVAVGRGLATQPWRRR